MDHNAGLAHLLEHRDGRHVGLGEVEHGSGVIAEVRAAWTRALIDDGARLLAIEGPWTGGVAIQAWLDADCQGASSLEISTKLSHKAFTDPTTAELLQWICVRNRVHADDPVRIIGFDNQDLGALDVAAAQLGMTVRALAGVCMKPGVGDPDPACLDALASPEVPELARIALTAYSAQLATSGLDSFTVRDEAMAELLRRQLTGPAVIWNHVVHLNEASDQTRTCWDGYASMLCRSLRLRSMGTHLADLDIVSVALTGADLELWEPSTPTRRRAGYRTAEAVLPSEAYVPLEAAGLSSGAPTPWVATLGTIRGDLSAAFDAIVTVGPGRSILPAQTLLPLGRGEPVTWMTSVPTAAAAAVAERALATGPWDATASTTRRDGWTDVTLTPTITARPGAGITGP